MIQNALAERRLIAAMYSDKPREFSPIALATKDDELHLRACQFGGESNHKCKCFTVARLSSVDVMPGEWRKPDDDPGPGSCIDRSVLRMRDSTL